MSARNVILAAIRANNGSTSVTPEWSELPRTYRRVSQLDRCSILERFEDRLRDYDATVLRCSPEELGTAVARRFAELKANTVLVAADFDPGFVEALPVTWKRDRELSYAELEACDAVLTTSTLGIAETGTLVLQGVPGQGRRALSLVPDVHVCLVNASDVVATVPEAFARLERTAALPPTFISGPSATADIERTRVKGVHGPRFLHVVLIEDESR
jgi:L-lactate dehydrogenase complex protein LldG